MSSQMGSSITFGLLHICQSQAIKKSNSKQVLHFATNWIEFCSTARQKQPHRSIATRRGAEGLKQLCGLKCILGTHRLANKYYIQVLPQLLLFLFILWYPLCEFLYITNQVSVNVIFVLHFTYLLLHFSAWVVLTAFSHE